ncbi:hypothetical protein [Peribacillus sp. SCS-155]|uniref:hypothetical protein n=1 Tax=Peribacillus sedimenti TaxID=3115297 RepID=UPI0039063E90
MKDIISIEDFDMFRICNEFFLMVVLNLDLKPKKKKETIFVQITPDVAESLLHTMK